MSEEREELRRLRRNVHDIYFKHGKLELHYADHICKAAVGNGVSSAHEEVEFLNPLSGPWCTVLLKRHLESDR